MVTGPSLIEDILVTNHDTFSIGPVQRESFIGIADHAVSMATGDDWDRLRQAFQPAFEGDVVEGYRDQVVAETEASIRQWTDGETLDLFLEMRRVTLRVLAETLLGVDIRGDEHVVMDASDALVDRANFRRPGRFLPGWGADPDRQTVPAARPGTGIVRR